MDDKSEKSLKIRDFEPLKENPFLVELDQGENMLKAKSKYHFGKSDKSMLIVNPATAEIEGHTVFMRTKKVDPERFGKLYINNLGSFFELGTREIRVFAYIMSILKPNADTIYFDIDECLEYTQYTSHVTVTKGLAKLLELQFLARSTKKHWYFINPTIFFNGDRISFVSQFRKDGKTKEISHSKGVDFEL